MSLLIAPAFRKDSVDVLNCHENLAMTIQESLFLSFGIVVDAQNLFMPVDLWSEKPS